MGILTVHSRLQLLNPHSTVSHLASLVMSIQPTTVAQPVSYLGVLEAGLDTTSCCFCFINHADGMLFCGGPIFDFYQDFYC